MNAGVSQGDAVAALKLGSLVAQGKVSGYGVAGDWFSKACDLGSLAGCHNVGVSYEYAKHGLSTNYPAAVQFYRRAAERGYMQSQYNLGSLYANNHLTDDVEGLKWMLISERSARKCLPNPGCKWTSEDPPGHMARLRKRMTDGDIRLAEQQAEVWQVTK